MVQKPLLVNIRKSVLMTATTLDELVRLGTLTPPAARFLEAAVAAGLNIVVAAAPSGEPDSS